MVTSNPTPSHQGTHHPLIAWWLAAGIVGADIGTSVFYSTSILLPHVGFAAPFFILMVVLLMWLFKATYQEGCAVSPINGGAYSMVLQTVGRHAALVVGSLTILSYLATAVVSALSGAYYLSSLWPSHWPIWAIFLVSAVPIVGFAILNLFGLRESAKIVFFVAAFHFGMLLVMDVWGLYVALTQGARWDRLWLGLESLAPHGILLGFAAAFLGITGFESAAQIIEELKPPTHLAIRKVYLTIVLLVAITSPVSSMLALTLLSDQELATFKDSLLSGLALVEGGRPMLVLLVMNACLTLFAAVNTAYAGCTGLLTTMGKQGNLPLVVLRRWDTLHPKLQGFPFVILPFMGLCLLLLAIFPGMVDHLGAIYGMAFLAVMLAYCTGVILMRVYQKKKVARAPYLNRWTFSFKGVEVPYAPVVGGGCLLIAETVHLLTSHEARNLGMQLFLGVLLIMAFYRLSRLEDRLVHVPDLRLGLGRYRGTGQLPAILPTYVMCTSGAQPSRLVTLVSYLLKKHQNEGPIEVVLFHAESKEDPHGRVAETLQRTVSQQMEEFFVNKEVVLTVKVLPGNLDEVLAEYQKAKPFQGVYISQGKDLEASDELRQHLENELGVPVVMLDEATLPKGPAVWFAQWSRERKRNWDRRPYGGQEA